MGLLLADPTRDNPQEKRLAGQSAAPVLSHPSPEHLQRFVFQESVFKTHWFQGKLLQRGKNQVISLSMRKIEISENVNV